MDAPLSQAPVHAFDSAYSVLERRWTLRIVACLLEGPHRFSDLKEALQPLSANILAQRLAELTEGCIVRKCSVSSSIKLPAYVLTDDGLRLKPVVAALTEWSRSRVGG